MAEQVDAIEVVETEGYGRSLRARVGFAAGEVVGPLTGRAVSSPGRYSIQVGADRHIDPDPPLRFMDHACEPTTRFDLDRMVCVAVRAIAPGEALTFFYPSTEWQMDAPFRCGCGSARCIGEVTGAADAPRKALAERVLAPHIAGRLAESAG